MSVVNGVLLYSLKTQQMFSWYLLYQALFSLTVIMLVLGLSERLNEKIQAVCPTHDIHGALSRRSCVLPGMQMLAKPSSRGLQHPLPH